MCKWDWSSDVCSSDLLALPRRRRRRRRPAVDEGQRRLAVGDGGGDAGEPGRFVTPGISWYQDELTVVGFERGGARRRGLPRDDDGTFSRHPDQREARPGGVTGPPHNPHDPEVCAAVYYRGAPAVQ